MNQAFYARMLFGTSAVMFGVVALIGHGTAFAWCVALGGIAGGLGVLFPRTARLGAVVLGVAYGVASLACIPGILRAPASYVQYGNFFEQFAVVCGALALYAATEGNVGRAAALGRTARVGFALCLISFAAAQVVYLGFTASLVPAWIPPSQVFWVILTTIAFALAALAVLIDFRARLALRLTTLMLVLFAVLVWIPQVVAHPAALSDWSELAETLLIAGSAWVAAGA